MNKELRKLIRTALEEDSVHRDVTTLSIIPASDIIRARLVVKSPGVVCGLKVFARVLKMLRGPMRIKFLAKDGKAVSKGEVIARICGPARSILSGERTALNFIQHLSGIATLTHKFVKKISGTRAKIYDTRKTIPGMRSLAKYAVLCGGGYNHRMDLSEMALIKDNHIVMLKDISSAVEKLRKSRKGIRIEIECGNLLEVKVALEAGADIIMLDNMDIKTAKIALKTIRAFRSPGYKPETEVSGGINLGSIRSFARAGVDRISVGALTHSVQALDISLEADDNK